ncbi:sigma-70 family RNA polymerase sigma factor [Pseudalkalibacillus sp. NRS-1564]|uniref:sigma-70 family RNA polymerase sigma factor n=1 Tax=Pseudalkalibacillus sp. NRS-1564 TaxID=3233900 RepID=UPI003D2B3E07
MEDSVFEDLVEQYMPLIKSQIKKLHLTNHYMRYEQVGMIALWECAESYQHGKGSFSSYAYMKVRGKLIDECRQEIRLSKQLALHSDWSEYEERLPIHQQTLLTELDLSNLTEKQSKWVNMVVLGGESLKTLAGVEGVSIEAVKSWRKSALSKLRKQLLSI